MVKSFSASVKEAAFNNKIGLAEPGPLTSPELFNTYGLARLSSGLK